MRIFFFSGTGNAMRVAEWVSSHANEKGLCTCTNPDFVAAMLKAMLQDWYLKAWKYQQKNINADQYVANLLLSVYQLLGVKS